MKWLRVDEAHMTMVLKEIGCVIGKKDENELQVRLKPINLKQKLEEIKAKSKTGKKGKK